MFFLLVFTLIPFVIVAQVPQYSQCGGIGYSGPTQCATGFTCFRQTAYYSQCLTSCPLGWECNSPSSTNSPSTAHSALIPQFGQCGGIGYTGNTRCMSGFTCFKQSDFYSQCLTICPGGNWECAATRVTINASTTTTRLVISTTTARPSTTTSTRPSITTPSTTRPSTTISSSTIPTTTTTTRGPLTNSSTRSTEATTTLRPLTTTSTSRTTSVSTTRLIMTNITTTRSLVTTTSTRPVTSTTRASVTVPIFGQCGGEGYLGATQCAPGLGCFRQHRYYSQCLTSCPLDWECNGLINQTTTTATSTTSRALNGTIGSTTPSSTITTRFSNSTCKFKFGNWFNGNNYDYSAVDYIGIWIGSHSPEFGNNFNIYWHGEMLKACLKFNKVPLYYGYIIAFLARQQWGLQDCDVGTPSLCQRGSEFIRTKRAAILATYLNYATETAKYMGTRVPSIWLIEPDFWQYYGDSSQQNGALTGAQMRSLFDDIATTIKSQVPNAIISWDISAWIGEAGMRQWWSFFATSTHIDFIHTSGGRSQANSIEIKQNELKWSFMSTLTGKKIIADTGYGVGGGSTGHNSDWDNLSNLRARIAEGVVAISQGNARGDWASILNSLRTQLPNVDQTKLCSF